MIMGLPVARRLLPKPGNYIGGDRCALGAILAGLEGGRPGRRLPGAVIGSLAGGGETENEMSHDPQTQEQWLDRTWALLRGDTDSLAAPGRIRREGLDHAQVRAAELSALDAAEEELAALRGGRKIRGRDGGLIDAEPIDAVPMFSFIETPAVDRDAVAASFGNPEQLLDAVIGEAGRRDLERSLNIRRIALLAEQEILDAHLRAPLPAAEVGSQWLRRWRQLAQDTRGEELRRLWARMLVREVAAPGRHSLATLEALGLIGERDVRGVLWLARYVFGEFIFDARGRYFRPDLHGTWIENAAAIGLLHAIDAPRRLLLHARPAGADTPDATGTEQPRPLLLINHNRALQLSELGSVGVPLPVLRLTALGRELFPLCGGGADMAYLLDLAAYLRERNVKVALGDWQPLQRRFRKRFEYG